MSEIFSRIELLLGSAAMEKLARSHVAVFGIGGVGGHCVEALARSGVCRFTLIDGDRVALSNINRQTVALHSTVGMYKTDVMRERILDINPGAIVVSIPRMYLPGDLELLARGYNLIVDAIDDVPAKVDLAVHAEAAGVRILSCMGAGDALGPARFVAMDLYETKACPLARAVRKAARERGVSQLRVICAERGVPDDVIPLREHGAGAQHPGAPVKTARTVPGSAVFVTATAGLTLAGEAVRMLLSD